MKRQKYIKINRECDFCLALQYERWLMEERCETYNRLSHVKGAVTRQGVKITNYVTLKKTRVIEKDTKIFPKFRFCPVCGFDYIEGVPYDGKKYKIDVNWKCGVDNANIKKGQRRGDQENG